ncbi:MAG: methylated-DNA--[protein]-cysteine S-methyltransferase [Chlamydiia bacterium]|nr:methylated-DNA--[protein]-cysteine S-methyltransferase [Chlamydiia bacterium]
MRTRTPYCAPQPALIQGSLNKGPALHANILLGQGTIDDVSLAFSKNNLSYTITSFHDQPELINATIDWLSSYTNKAPNPLTLPLRLDHATLFTKQALDALTKVPFGKTASYKDIAIAIKNEKATRAVGSVCHHNPFPLFIPCHRIVSSQGLGGFAYPMEMKKMLLNFESFASSA